MKKFTYIFAILVAGMFVNSCLDEKVEPYTPAVPDVDGCYRVSFPEQTVCAYELDPTDETASTVTIKAKRKVTTGKITVPITITQVPFDKDFVFTNTELVFEDGDDETTFQVSFPTAETGVDYACHITIEDPQYASAFAKDTTYFSFNFIKVKWETKAVGVIDSWWAEDIVPDVTLQHCETFPERYRFVDPYGYGKDLLFTTVGEEQEDKDGDKFYNVRVKPTFSGRVNSYGEVWYQDYAYYTGNDDDISYSVIYPEDAYVYIVLNWYVPIGSYGAGAEEFYVPSAGGGE